MNRKQRRAFVKRAKKKGVSEREAKAYAEIVSEGTGTHTKAQEIQSGDKVMLNIEAVKNRRNYSITTDKYKDFVNKSEGKVFTAVAKGGGLVELEGKPWLFWCGDLVVMEENDEQNEDNTDEKAEQTD